MVTEEEAEELVRANGAAEILNDVPIHNSEKGCVLTDYDAVEWAKCEDLGDGTYKISFSLKEEINAEKLYSPYWTSVEDSWWNFVKGAKNMGSDWTTLINEMKAKGVNKYIAVLQGYYDRCNK